MFTIGPYQLNSNVVLAPMAGITDTPFRQLCYRLGAGLVVSEMLSSNPQVWNTDKSLLRMTHGDDVGVVSVQIAGCDPKLMADAARFNVDNGAQIVDINMGCPAKKVNKKAAGSALLQHPELVADILRSVVSAVDVPVTLKIRTGWHPDHRNGVDIARIAEDCGVQSLAVHGRTRACMFKGEAEFDTIKAIKSAIRIPVLANGDITSPERAKEVLQHTGADGIMIGRGAQGRPWIFREINHYLRTGEHLAAPAVSEIRDLLLEHLHKVHEFYGEGKGVRIARKHVGWYLAQADEEREFRRQFNGLESAQAQHQALQDFFNTWLQREASARVTAA